MKKLRLRRALAMLLGIALLWATAIPAAAAWTEEDYSSGYNLLMNPGFEEGDSDWMIEGNAELAESAAYTGDAGILLQEQDSAIEQDIKLYGGVEYAFKMAIKREIEDAFYIEISITNNVYEQYMLEISMPDGEWHRVSQTFVLPEDISGVLKIKLIGNDSICIDDIFLGPTDFLPPALDQDESSNLLNDGGFENGGDDWQYYTKHSSVSLANVSRTGSHSLNVSTSTESIWLPNAVVKLPDVSISGEYEVTAYFLAPEAKDKSKALLEFYQNYNKDSFLNLPVISVHTSMPASNSHWVKASFTVELYEGLSYYIGVGSDKKTSFFVDDISVIPTGYEFPQPEQEPEPQNLLENPDFEHSLSGWTQQGSLNSFSTDAQAYSGSNSAYFGYFASEPLNNYLEQSCAAGAGSYTFSAMVKPDATLRGAGAMLMLEALDANGKVIATIASQTVNDPAKGWQEVQATLTAPAQTVRLRAKIGGVYCTGAFYVDAALLISRT